MQQQLGALSVHRPVTPGPLLVLIGRRGLDKQTQSNHRAPEGIYQPRQLDDGLTSATALAASSGC